MSLVIETLAKIDSSGGVVSVQDGEVRFKVPPGLLSDQDRAVLAKHRDDILAMLTPVDVDTTTPHSGKTAIVSTDWEPEVVEDLEQWLRENTVEPDKCDQCGGLECWEDLAGGRHCLLCDPPVRANKIRERAEKLRQHYSMRLLE